MFPTLVVLAALSTSPQPKAVVITPDVAAKLQEIAFQAAREGDLDTLREYFAAGRPVNETNKRGDTLLIVAAYNGQPKAVALILKQTKVEIDARNKMGLTALSAAAFKGEVNIAKALVEAKADVNAASESGQTALMFAALAGREKMVEYLLTAGADPKAMDKAGNTPLTLAKGQGAEGVQKLLQDASQAPTKSGK
ncbi:ankyrin repeat domain-containing protein [Limnoglobus roseus]|uniref:Ankyrin repeat domain-containing protein n=1 Tax=Limnoglobus roseus TaxID=2598579 RepID=A0A5C1AU06_9BACT|nr:ankyrin repeat domain-containing protein [Limnoglobus roseus]QEL20268.1 ankyrin repeat domain-containing protein [Limnoglobus roseus]